MVREWYEDELGLSGTVGSAGGASMRIYVASSWRNQFQPTVVTALAADGYETYDFRNPSPGDHGFAWSAIDPEWEQWGHRTFRTALAHPVATSGYNKDMQALFNCHACVLVLPAGRSAHLETGWAVGACRYVAILIPEAADPVEPELMYRMADSICIGIGELLQTLRLNAQRITAGWKRCAL